MGKLRQERVTYFLGTFAMREQSPEYEWFISSVAPGREGRFKYFSRHEEQFLSSKIPTRCVGMGGTTIGGKKGERTAVLGEDAHHDGPLSITVRTRLSRCEQRDAARVPPSLRYVYHWATISAASLVGDSRRYISDMMGATLLTG